MSRHPSGNQSIQNGIVVGTRTMTSLFPSRSTATTSCLPQLENHRRPSCQRGDSPNPRPVNRVRTSGTLGICVESFIVFLPLTHRLVAQEDIPIAEGSCLCKLQ